MEIRNSQKSSTVSGLVGDAAFSANVDGIAFQTLIGNLYKDKPRAVVRETISNQRDAHTWRDQMYGSITVERILEGSLTPSEQQTYDELKAAGYADPGTPYKIHIPTTLEPFLEFEDFGIGLTLDEAIGKVDITASEAAGRPIRTGGYLNTMFNSSKRGENVSIGGFGLGCKCPLSIVDSFTYRIIKNGEEHQFIVFFTKDGIPDVNWLTHDEDYNPTPISTDRENGVIVTLDTVQTSLFSYIKTCVSDILQTFPSHEQPIINEGEYKFTPMVVEDLTDSIYVVRQFNYGSLFNHSYLVECGGVIYPIDSTRMADVFDGEMMRMLSAASRGCAVVARMPLGSVKVPPSREEISYDDVTIENISERFKAAYEKIKQSCLESLNNIDFTKSKSIKGCYKFLSLYYYEAGKVLKLIEDKFKEVKETDEKYKFFDISLGFSRNDNLEIGIHYYDPKLKALSNAMITASSRYNVDTNKYGKSFVENYPHLISSSRAIFSDSKAQNDLYFDLTQINNKVVLFKNIPEGETIVSLTNKIARQTQNINRNKTPKEQLDEDYLTLMRCIEGLDTRIYSIIDKNKKILDIEASISFNYKIETPGFSKLVSGPPTKKVNDALAQLYTYKNIGDEDYYESLYDCLDRFFKMSNKENLVEYCLYDASDIMDTIEETKKIIKKNITKAPKRDEIKRNVMFLDLSSYRNKGEEIFITRDFESYSYSDSNYDSTNDINGAGKLGAFLDNYESENTIYWIREENFANQSRKIKVGDFYITNHTLNEFLSNKLNSGRIFIVKGVRTTSVKAFLAHPCCVEIELGDLVNDYKENFTESFLSGTSPVFKEVSYERAWRFGFDNLYHHALIGEFFHGANMSLSSMRLILKLFNKESKNNKEFTEFLRLKGLNLGHMYEFITKFISDDIYLKVKHDSFTGIKIMSGNSWSPINRNIFINTPLKEVGFSVGMMNAKHKVFDDLIKNKMYTAKHKLDTSIFPDFVKTAVPSETLDVIRQIVFFFDINESKVRRQFTKALKITEKQIETINSFKVDYEKISKRVLSAIKKDLSDFETDIGKLLSVEKISECIESNLEYRLVDGIRSKENPFISRQDLYTLDQHVSFRLKTTQLYEHLANFTKEEWK